MVGFTEDHVRIISGKVRGVGEDVLLKNGLVGTVSKTYVSWKRGRDELRLIVRISPDRARTVWAADVKLVIPAL